MQQVSRAELASAIAVTNPRGLPATARRAGSSLLGAAKRGWVLHRKLLVRAAALLIAAAAATAFVHYRDGIANAFGLVTDRAAHGFASAGLAIEKIEMTGHTLTDEASLLAALGIGGQMSIVAFDAEAARARLESLPAIAEASVKKVYPSSVTVTLVERLPVARWRVDGVTFAIDATGAQLAVLNGAGADLPLVIGDGAADDAAAIITIIDHHPLLQRRLLAISRIADRRWDLIYDNGLRIMLPETGIEATVELIERLDADHALLARDLAIIDLRVPDRLAVRPADRSEPVDQGAAS